MAIAAYGGRPVVDCFEHFASTGCCEPPWERDSADRLEVDEPEPVACSAVESLLPARGELAEHAYCLLVPVRREAHDAQSLGGLYAPHGGAHLSLRPGLRSKPSLKSGTQSSTSEY